MQVNPKGDLVLAKVAEAEDKTIGGVLLPDTAQRKPTSGAHPPHFLQRAFVLPRTMDCRRGCHAEHIRPHHASAGKIMAVGVFELP